MASKELASLLALAATIGLLMQVQSGALDLAGLFGKPPPAAKGKARGGGSAGKANLLPSVAAPDLLALAADKYLPVRRKQVGAAAVERAHLLKGLAGMDGRSGALLLAKLEPQQAADTLAQLPGRSVARILDEADPEAAAAWARTLLAAELPAVPDELKPAAAEAGLYDDFNDLLAQLRAGTPAAEADGATPAGEAGTAADGAAPAGQPPTEESAPPP